MAKVSSIALMTSSTVTLIQSGYVMAIMTVEITGMKTQLMVVVCTFCLITIVPDLNSLEYMGMTGCAKQIKT